MTSYLFLQVCLLWGGPAKWQKAYCRIIGEGTGVHFCLRYFKLETSRMRDRPLFELLAVQQTLILFVYITVLMLFYNF
jgi:hypothetical protein